ncbi:MAG: B12-binding domain-containing protein [Phycisphaerae bacterium]
MRPIISPRELAIAIGLSESSLKRWADDGIIQVTRTAGGHRRIAIGEAIRFVRSIGAPLLRPDILGLRDLPIADDAAQLAATPPGELLLAALKRGDARAARGIVLSLYLAGQSVAAIADGPIRDAMAQVGDLWRHDPANVYVEHRATDICLQAVQQLRQLVEPAQTHGTAIGAAPPGDPYLLPSLLAATALAAESWNTTNLGPDMPFRALVAAVGRHRPALVWLSVSSMQDGAEMSDGLAGLLDASTDEGPTILVGGRAAAELELPKSPRVQRGATLAELVAMAQALRERNEAAAPGFPPAPDPDR